MEELEVPIWSKEAGDNSPYDTAMRYIADYQSGRERDPMARAQKIIYWTQGSAHHSTLTSTRKYYERVYELLQHIPYSRNTKASKYITNSLLK